MKRYIILFTLFACLTVTHAAVVIAPITITYTGTATEEPLIPNEDNLIDGSGLSATPTISNYTTVTHAAVNSNPGSQNTWATNQPNGESGDFFTGNPGSVIFEFAFDQVYELTDLISWNYFTGSGFNGNDVSQISIDYGIGDFSQNAGGYDVAIASVAGGYSQTSLGSFQANQLRITITDNRYEDYAGGDRVGLAEMRFIGTVVPEPSQFALALGLLSVLTISLRRRR